MSLFRCSDRLDEKAEPPVLNVLFGVNRMGALENVFALARLASNHSIKQVRPTPRSDKQSTATRHKTAATQKWKDRDQNHGHQNPPQTGYKNTTTKMGTTISSEGREFGCLGQLILQRTPAFL
mmetsp:Transcript_6266/g.14140  ORF Transcript_6266/g.14140 Transcript_6266/m.14140 type:complete len:123 (-) Transcript_6266:948-1316(-)